MSFLLDGPVILPKYNGRNKTFWLFGLQRHQELGATAGTFATVPTPAMESGDFTFGGQINPKPLTIYDPATEVLQGTTWTSTPFPGNQIPQNRFDPVAVKFLSLDPFAAPNLPGVASSTALPTTWA